MLTTDYQNYIHLSRYSRYLPEKGRREFWSETVGRYFDFMEVHLLKTCNYVLQPLTRQTLEEAVLNLEIMPSMRSLMTAGPALERENLSGYNCFSHETEILTKEFGRVEIGSLVGKEIHVLTSNKSWEKTVVRSFGEQKLQKLTLSFYRRKKEIYVTEDHNWHLSDGRIVKTKDLVYTDRIPINLPKRPILSLDNEDYLKGLIHGIVYGDGSCIWKNTDEIKGFTIKLCGPKEDLLPIFEKAGYSYSYPASGKDPQVYIFDQETKDQQLKDLPEKEKSDEYLIGFFRGWFATDGTIGEKGQCAIHVTKSGLNFLKEINSRLGYVSDKDWLMPSKTNYGIRNQPCYGIRIERWSLTEEDFILPIKAKRFKPLEAFYVPEISSSTRKEEVFCVTVPSTGNFTLGNGALTGNCAYLEVNRPKAFADTLYVLMCGTGLGFSVERQVIKNLPEIPKLQYHNDIITVEDSKEGWAQAYNELIDALYLGNIPRSFNTDKVRPAGAPLKTFGGRASGPKPLIDLFMFTIDKFVGAQGRRLNSIEAHDIMCKIGEVVVVGGVRRSAMISLSNLSDDRMRVAKSGNWWETEKQRALSNNSIAFTEKPDVHAFLKEFLAIYESRSGERGIFSRYGAEKKVRDGGRRNPNHSFGCNPCAEILLRDRELCNLTEVVIRPNDTPASIIKKIMLATILGTFQSTLTNFQFVDEEWAKNCIEERLLGVSLTGIMDNVLTSGKSGAQNLAAFLERAKAQAIATNKQIAAELGINPSVAVTTVKPSGTVSQLVDCRSGIHAAHSEFYIRTVRSDNKDPLCKFMIDQGVPHEPCVMKPNDVTVFSFPVHVPKKGAIFRDDLSAIQHLEIVKIYNSHWAEHSVSVTVNLKEEEWPEVSGWVYRNFDSLTGISFLPHTEHSYMQAPYQEVDEQGYRELVAKSPKNIDWSNFVEYETGEDTTHGAQNLACSGTVCEIVDTAG